jgi:dTDP-4-dehydrorhamnose 3,5-epimerase
MEYVKTLFRDLYICKPTIFHDSRGYFYESFNAKHFSENTGISIDFVQDNQSYSKAGVIRGFHTQGGNYEQAKLVRCIKGKICDIVVDLRKNEPTFGKHFSIELSEENHWQLFIPRGFAHGFSVLTEEAVFSYKCDNFYNKESELGIAYNDPKINADWKIPSASMVISEKDQNNFSFDEAVELYYKL